MKKRVTATALLLIPSYLIFFWIYVFNSFPKKSQAEKVAYFQGRFIPVTIDFAYLSVLGVIATLFAIVLLLRNNQGMQTAIKIYSYALSAFAVGMAVILLVWMM